MKVIDFEQIRALNISPAQYFRWVSEMIQKKEEAILPAKLSLKPADGVFYNIMPSLLPKEQFAGVKVVTRYPARLPALDSEILLYDMHSGLPCALLDGTYITAVRTGAVAAHSVKLLANPDFQTVGFIGLGNTARAAMEMLLMLYPNKQLTVKLLKYKNQHELFAARFPSSQIQYVYCDTPQAVVENSDVILSAVTVFEEDICNTECFKAGCLVVPIHTRGFTNCDLVFDKVYADDTAHVHGFKNFGKFRFFAEVADVVNGKAPGRERETERILAYNIGLSIHDIYLAEKIYTAVTADREIDLKAPKEKFWY